MATSKTFGTVKLASILTIPAMNGSRGIDISAWFKDAADMLTLASELVNGWKEQHGMVFVTPLADFWGDKAQEAYDTACKARLSIYDILKASEDTFTYKGEGQEVQIAPADVLLAYQDIYFVKGVVAFPKVEKAVDQICAFRRIFVMPLVNAILGKLGRPAITELPVVFEHYEGIPVTRRGIERTITCMGENEYKTQGHLPTTTLQKIVATKNEIFDKLGTEADATRALGKRGMAQKCWKICQIDTEYPEAGIFKLLAGPDGAKLAGAYRYEEMVKIRDEHRSKADVAAWAKKPYTTEGAKMLKKPAIIAIANQAPNPILKAVAKAVVLGDRRFIDLFLEEDVKADITEGFLAVAAEVFELAGKLDVYEQWLVDVLVPIVTK